ncbi:hypothetical protein H4R20_001707 [Coemansia guatemalensis]|uniref:Uncharacterized protein n=1 Tax=Coemansia guatemalensis TaxID=2761395 RepID=A0A9W8LUA7_9FUNG|nr:hypothetical protein H4R20_001707 [Coemansia guatemalensis]
MPEAAPSAVSSDITMESIDSLEHVPPEQLSAFVQRTNAVLGNSEETRAPDSVALSHTPSATDASSAANNHPKISCDTFTAQATKFSGEDLRMSAAKWVEVNKHEFAAYLPGIQEQMRLNAAYPLLTGEAKTAVGQLLFNTLEELYQYLLDAFPQTDFKMKVLQVINSRKLFKDMPKRALGAYAYAIYHNMDQSNPLAAFLITNNLYVVNTLPFALKDTKPQEIQPADVEKICKYFDRINTIECEPEWAQQGNASASNASRKKKKKRGNGSGAQSNGNALGANAANTSHSSAPSTGRNASQSATTTGTRTSPLN